MPAAKDIFLRAIEFTSLEKRASFIADACGDNTALKRRVAALLAAHDDPDSYLEKPAAKFDVTATHDSGGAHLSDSSSSHHGRFLPGTKVTGRYRIVSMLGRGGMGEVYRADDLRLGQTVALKFLPPELAKDAKRLKYFHNEVRLARQIAHPNVCRVYDIGEVDGQHFISMEYIDGEDLKTLLHRIGRLPQDKGIEMAQQICVGLAAAHSSGVLHRDLKPANIMVDGNGRIRITDFGLATIAQEGESIVGLSGTPAYMAPEQLLAGETSVQSDIYAIGLVLFELFTGQRANLADSLADLKRVHSESSTPTDPGEFVGDLAPAVRNAIRRCMASDPADRPRSMSAVLATLPGGDPLAAALAAGETPVPELVAAAGSTGMISLRLALLGLLSLVVGLVVILLLADQTHFVNSLDLPLSAENLQYEARKILDHLGHQQDRRDAAYGFEGIRQWDDAQPGFWYREAPDALIANQFFESWSRTGSRVDFNVPKWTQPGMLGLRMSTTGTLRYFRAVPTQDVVRSSTQEPEWTQLFPQEIIGADLASLRVADLRKTPPDAYDHAQSWEGTPSGASEPIYIQAASYNGLPTYFEVLSEGQLHPDDAADESRNVAILYFFVAIIVIVSACTIFLAWRNWRLRRGDRRGALRYAIAMIGIGFGQWLFQTNHVGDWRESYLLIHGLNMISGTALLSWLNYMALEPLMRRYWPETLISWARLLEGRFTDPRVGRDILVGVLFQVVLTLYLQAAYIGIGPEAISGTISQDEDFLMGAGSAACAYLALFWPLSLYLYYLAVVILLLAMTRSKIVGIAGYVCMITIVATGTADWTDPARWIMLIYFLVQGMFLARFGFWAWLVSGFALGLMNSPITTNAHAFYFHTGVLNLVLAFAVALWGAFIAVGGLAGLSAYLDGKSQPVSS